MNCQFPIHDAILGERPANPDLGRCTLAEKGPLRRVVWHGRHLGRTEAVAAMKQ